MKSSLPRRIVRAFLPATLLLLLGGCASIEKRIEANVELFSSYPDEVQTKLREGRIEVGYTMKMVEIAKGKPTYIHLKQSAEGQTTIWRYMQFRQYTRPVPVYDTGIRGASWVNVSETEEVEVLRVEFREGLVLTVEEVL